MIHGSMNVTVQTLLPTRFPIIIMLQIARFTTNVQSITTQPEVIRWRVRLRHRL